MVEDIFLNALDGTAVFNKIRSSSLSVSFHLFPIYKHKPKYNLLAIVLPLSDTFPAFQ